MQTLNASIHSSNYNISFLLFIGCVKSGMLPTKAYNHMTKFFFSRKLIWNKNSGTLTKSKIVQYNSYISFFHIQEVAHCLWDH